MFILRSTRNKQTNIVYEQKVEFFMLRMVKRVVPIGPEGLISPQGDVYVFLLYVYVWLPWLPRIGNI